MTEIYSIVGLEAQVLVVGRDGTVEYANAAFCRALRRSREEVVGRSLMDIDRLPVGAGALERVAALSRAETGKAVSFETGYANPETGETEHVRIGAQAVGDGVQIVIEDCSARYKLEQAFQRYVGPKVMERLLASGRDFDIPERREITALFVDLRGFTVLAQTLPPEDVRTTINAYLDEAIRRVYALDGTVDKIVGDEIVALFGAPLPTRDHALRALRCAADVMQGHTALVESWSRKGRTMPSCGIGIETGMAVVGNIGSTLQRDYTAIGATMNMAARLCASARAGRILATETVVRRAAEQAIEIGEKWIEEPLDPFPLKETDLGQTGQVVGVDASPRRGERMRAGGLDFTWLDLFHMKGFDHPAQILDVRTGPSWTGAAPIAISDSTESVSAGIRTFGDYDLIETIGRGGMGVVYKARHRILGRTVALKMLMAGEQASEAQIARFARETRAMAALQHPHIVRVYDVGQAENFHFFTMEFVDGVALDRIIAAAGGVSSSRGADTTIAAFVSSVADAPPPPVEADAAPPAAAEPSAARNLTVNQRVGIVASVLEALAYAHGRSVVHRDVKPGNVMISRGGEAMLMDFGLAAAREESDAGLTQTGMLLGTTAYMAPEQAEGRTKAVDERTDVYAAGVILYELITGRRPFASTGNPAVDLITIVRDDPPRPRSIDAAVPEELEHIILKAMEKDPNRRYVTAQAFADDLGRYLRNEPILARPPSLAYALRKNVARYPGIWATAAAAAVLLLGLAGWSFRRIALERTDAIAARDRAEASMREALSQAHISKGTSYIQRGRLREAFAEFDAGYAAVQSWEAQAMLGQVVHARGRLLLSIEREAPIEAGLLLIDTGPGRVVLAEAGGVLTLHDARGIEIARQAIGRPISALAQSMDGALLAAGTADGEIMLLSARDLSVVARAAGEGNVVQIAFGRDSVVAAARTARSRWVATIYGVPELNEMTRSEAMDWSRQPPRMGFSGTGDFIAQGGTGGQALQVWSPALSWRKAARAPGSGYYNYVTEPLPFANSDGLCVSWMAAQAADEGSIATWRLGSTDSPAPQILGEFRLMGGRIRDVRSLSFSSQATGGSIGLVGEEGIEIWTWQDGAGSWRMDASLYFESLLPHETGVVKGLHTDLAIGRVLVASGNRAHVFHSPVPPSGYKPPEMIHAHVESFPPAGLHPFAMLPEVNYTLALTPEAVWGTNDRVISRYGFSNGELRLYMLPPAEKMPHRTWYEGSGAGFGVSADGRTAVRLHRDRIVFLDLEKVSAAEKRILLGLPVELVRLVPDAVGAMVTTAEPAYQLINGVSPRTFDVSPDGARVVVVDDRGGVEMAERSWPKGKKSSLLGDGASRGFSFASTGDWRFIAVGSFSRESAPVRVWKVEDVWNGSGEPFFTSPPRSVTKLALHASLPILYIGIDGLGAEVWDMTTGEMTGVIPDAVAPIAGSPDGKLLLAAKSNARTVLFDILAADDGRPLVPAPWPSAHILSRGGISADGRHAVLVPNQDWVAVLRVRTPAEARHDLSMALGRLE